MAGGSLGLVLISLTGMGQAQQAPKELVLEKLTISEGKDGATIVLMSGNRYAGIIMSDANGKTRIMVKTLPTGAAGIDHFDSNGKKRISVSTDAQGMAAVSHLDAKEGPRIVVATAPDGTAGTIYQNYNTNGELELVRTLP